MKKSLQSFFGGLGLMLSLLLFVMSALSSSAQSTATQESTASVNLTDGTFTIMNSDQTYAAQWTSTPYPQLTFSNEGTISTTTGCNMQKNSSTNNIQCYSSRTFILAVAGGQVIESVSFNAKECSTTASGVTLSLNGDAADTLTVEDKSYSVSGLSATSVNIAIKGTSSKWVELSDFTVKLKGTFTGTAYKVLASTGSFTGSGEYHNQWDATSTTPRYRLSTTKNNMKILDETSGSLGLWSGDANATDASGEAYTSTYVIKAGSAYQITGYSLSYKYGDATTTARKVITNGSTFTASANESTITYSVSPCHSISFIVKGEGNAPLLFNDITVYLASSEDLGGRRKVAIFDELDDTYPYRIPAIAKTYDGTLLAVSDYRVCGADIGNGDIDLVVRRSTDNGTTWDAKSTIVDGSSTCGYGDAAIVADRESSKVLLVCVTGKITYGSSTSSNRMPLGYFTSDDNGKTWSSVTDITSDIYGLFENSTKGALNACFFGSGRICQSSVVKVGNYYRLYAALCAKPNGNRVIYSDDFGKTWNILGDIDDLPAVSGDEPKCEELPDGSVILSSRMNGGRYFNIFTYAATDGVAKGTGTWGTVATSSSSNNGTTAVNNSTNGEILVLPATRNSDGKEVYVALQSIPFAGSRTNVGIHYKELSSLDDVKDPSTFASNWDGHLQISSTTSAYSTMIVQQNDSIAFLYEEEKYNNGHGDGYTIVYEQLNLYGITGGAYSYKSSVNSKTLVHDVLQERVDAINTDKDLEAGMALGMLTPTSATTNTENSDATKAVNIYDTTPTAQGYADAMAALAKITTSSTATYNQPVANTTYVFTNKANPTYRLTLKETTTTTTTTDETTGTETSTSTTTYSYVGTTDEVDNLQKFQLVATGTEGVWYVYNEEKKQYMGPSPADYNVFAGVSDVSSAGTFTITSGTDGYSYLTCTNPTSSHVNPHLDSGKNIVPWSTDNDATYWKIAPYDEAETARTALIDSINIARQYVLGTSLGTYTDPNASNETNSLSAVLSAAVTVAVDMSNTATTLANSEKAVYNAVKALTLNQPASGSFIRIRTTSESHATQPYLLPYNSNYNSDRAALGAGTEKETIFYYADEKLLSYYNGYYLTNNYLTGGTTDEKYAQALYNGVCTAAPVSFPAATTGASTIGKYALKYASNKYLYANSSGTTYYGDAWKDNPGNLHCNYELEEVTSLPVTVSSVEWSTLCAPVALTIPESDDLYVYTGKRSGEYLQLTRLTGTLPVNTPVVINAVAGTYYFAIDKTSEAENENNSSLSGTVEAITVEAGAHLTLQYIDEIGFYQFLGTEIPGFKSYISAEVAQNVRGLIFSPTTAIDQVETAQPAMQDKTIYDLQGRRVNKAGKGIYIIGGKKVIRF